MSSFCNKVVSEIQVAESLLRVAERLLVIRNGFGRRCHHSGMIKLDSSIYSL
jgi:hypothetical protein